MASRNCFSINFNFAPLLRSRQHFARRYGWNAARVWCSDVWRTRVWWTRVRRTRVTRLTRLSWLWRAHVWWTRVWRTRVTRFTRLSWLWWTRVRWTHASVTAEPGKEELGTGSTDFGRLDQFFQPIHAIPATLPSTVSGGISISSEH